MTPEEWERAGRRLEEIRSTIVASWPKTCPNCASDNLIPGFPGPEHECLDCGQPVGLRSSSEEDRELWRVRSRSHPAE